MPPRVREGKYGAWEREGRKTNGKADHNLTLLVFPPHVFRRDTFTMYGAGSACAKATVMLVQSAAKQQAKRRGRQQVCPLLAVNDMPVVVS